MASSEKEKAQSNFNFFAVLEDTISGVIEFLFRFVSVTLLCLFRPHRFVERYRQSGSFSEAGFPRPFTFLIFCIFSFIKGLEMLPGSGSKTPTDPDDVGIYLTKVHDTINQFGEITTLQIILSVFPTVVVILMFSFIVTLPHRLANGPGYRESSQVFSYVFGAQITGALALIYAAASVVTIVNGNTAEIIGTVAFLIALVWFIASATRALRHWFDVASSRLIGKVALYAVYTAVALIVAAAYIYTITGAYSQLDQDNAMRMSDTEKTALAEEEIGSRLVLTVYGAAIRNETVTVSMLLENRSDSTYFVHEKGSMLILSAIQEVLDELNVDLDKEEVLDESQVQAQLEATLDRLALGYSIIELKRVEPGSAGRVVEPGQRMLLQFEGELKDRTAISMGVGSRLSIPVARVNSDGSLSYASISRDLGQPQEDLYDNLEKERIKSNEEMDELTRGLQQIIDQLKLQADE